MDFIPRNLPWWARIALKVALSQVPLKYSFWQALRVFRHGSMDDPGYAIDVFETHWNASRPLMANIPDVAVEVGPGDSLASAVIARAHAIGSLKLVDAGAFARSDLGLYRRLGQALIERGLRPCELDDVVELSQLLRRCGCEYLTDGVLSLEHIPAGSVAWVWSHAVLEHVRLREVDRLIWAMRKMMQPGAIAAHRIDLKDHLGGGLNNLRFEADVWERDGFAFRSGFYTNRLRARDWIAKFGAAGFEIIAVEYRRWPAPPLPRSRLARQFRSLPDSELEISGIDLLLRAS